eukprot:TRINITY_DN23655_c0_g1_i1.p1 TRINITY_DN23655_c0_g1~~TRINITY_DN23655_c0_g1_i1.p1  ORF type:complete len:318 (+),score=40.56 TRINITY_DN23655_c0_g1_i1:74-1027(+)
MQRCCRAVIERTLRETDTPEQARRKGLWMPVMALLAPLPPMFFFYEGDDSMTQAQNIGYVMSFLTVNAGIWWPLLTRSLPSVLVSGVLCGLAVAVLFIDAKNAAAMYAFRPWAFIVLIMDMCLALNEPKGSQGFIMCLVTTWTVVYSVEMSYRLGLFDIEGFTDTEEIPVCDCAAPPCAYGTFGLFVMPPVLAILLGDYFATRGFAEGLRAEQATMRASVEVAELVAGSLAGFDLDAAGNVLVQAGKDLPHPLACSFGRLLHNLASYRPYLSTWISAPGAAVCRPAAVARFTPSRFSAVPFLRHLFAVVPTLHNTGG